MHRYCKNDQECSRRYSQKKIDDVQHQESEHKPGDQVNSEGISKLLSATGDGSIRVDDTAGRDENGSVGHPEGAIRRES